MIAAHPTTEASTQNQKAERLKILGPSSSLICLVTFVTSIQMFRLA